MTTPAHKKTPPQAPTVITITLPDEATLLRTGTILVQRGTLAALRQFTYADLTGIVQAIQEAAVHLLDVEKNPPVIADKPTETTKPDIPSADEESALETPSEDDPTEDSDRPAHDDATMNLPLNHNQLNLL